MTLPKKAKCRFCQSAKHVSTHVIKWTETGNPCKSCGHRPQKEITEWVTECVWCAARGPIRPTKAEALIEWNTIMGR